MIIYNSELWPFVWSFHHSTTVKLRYNSRAETCLPDQQLPYIYLDDKIDDDDEIDDEIGDEIGDLALGFFTL